MRSFASNVGIIVILSLVSILLLCYEQPDPLPGAGEINVVVGLVGAFVCSARWLWSRARGPVASH